MSVFDTRKLSMFLMGGGPVPTSPIVKAVVKQTVAAARKRKGNKRAIRVLVVPSAKFTLSDYNDALLNAGKLLGASGFKLDIKVLHAFDTLPKRKDALAAIAEADMFYIPGGSTVKALEFLRRARLLRPLLKAIAAGTPTWGHSFGAGGWGELLFTDSQSYGLKEGEPWMYELIRTMRPGERIFECAMNVHADDLAREWTNNPDAYDEGTTRRDAFVMELQRRAASGTRTNGMSIDGHTTLHVQGRTVTVLGTGIVTLHIWGKDGRLHTRTYHEGQRFRISTLRRTNLALAA